jgi:arsenate reductase
VSGCDIMDMFKQYPLQAKDKIVLESCIFLDFLSSNLKPSNNPDIRGDSMMLFLCYPKCATCRKAQKWLDDNKLSYDLRDIKADNPSYDELKAWYEKSGLPLKSFFNTSGLLYKSLELKDRLPAMSEEEQLRLLSADGMLVKRPILAGEDFVLVGFKQAEWEAVK